MSLNHCIRAFHGKDLACLVFTILDAFFLKTVPLRLFRLFSLRTRLIWWYIVTYYNFPRYHIASNASLHRYRWSRPTYPVRYIAAFLLYKQCNLDTKAFKGCRRWKRSWWKAHRCCCRCVSTTFFGRETVCSNKNCCRIKRTAEKTCCFSW